MTSKVTTIPSSIDATKLNSFPLTWTENSIDSDQCLDDNHKSNELEKGGTSSVLTSTFNLCKSIIGAGVLSLPHGLAVYASDPKALLPAVVLCAVFAFASAYSFISIGTLCKETGSSSFREVWSRNMDPKSAWVISASICLMCLLSSLTYIIVIADSFLSIAQVTIHM